MCVCVCVCGGVLWFGFGFAFGAGFFYRFVCFVYPFSMGRNSVEINTVHI